MNSIGTKELYTERLVLRKFKESDAKELFLGFVNQEDFLYYANKEKRTLEEEQNALINIDKKYN